MIKLYKFENTRLGSLHQDNPLCKIFELRKFVTACGYIYLPPVSTRHGMLSQYYTYHNNEQIPLKYIVALPS